MSQVFDIPTTSSKLSDKADKARAYRHRRRFGQNFLVDRNVARNIVDAANIDENSETLEIGPGRGALTRFLIRRAARIVAVEIDTDLAESLPNRLGSPDNLTVVNEDALDFDARSHLDSGYTLIGNLPYNAATPIVRRYLTSISKPKSMIVMVQREVARVMAASAGDMSFLSVIVQMHGSVKMLFSVPPRAFRPAPKVTSAVVRIDLHDRPEMKIEDADSFVEFAAAGFRSPRKQIRNSLRAGLGAPADAVSALLRNAQIDPTRRPSTLGLDEWAALHRIWNESNEGIFSA